MILTALCTTAQVLLLKVIQTLFLQKKRIFHLALLLNSAHWILNKQIYFIKQDVVRKSLLINNHLYKIHCSCLLDSRSASESKSTLPPPSPPPPSPTVASGRCNKKISGMTGTFSPPDSPYRSNTDCAWLIEVPKGYYITLRIYNIQIE